MTTKESNGQNIVLQKSADTVAKAVFKTDKGIRFEFIDTLHDKNPKLEH